MKRLILCFVLSMVATAPAHGAWKLRSVYQKAPGLEVDRSVLFFNSGEVTKKYAPAEAPLGLVDSKLFSFSKRKFFLTSWPKGGQSVLFRVFDMSKEQPVPICEIVSYSETSKLKIKNGALYLLKSGDSQTAKPKWSLCGEL